MFGYGNLVTGAQHGVVSYLAPKGKTLVFEGGSAIRSKIGEI
jgi:hypothetical protein